MTHQPVNMYTVQPAEPAEPAEPVGAEVMVIHPWWGPNEHVIAYRYPGTAHWFAAPSRDACVPAPADLAFDRTVAFLRRYLV